MSAEPVALPEAHGSFFLTDGSSFVPTPWTRGPWSPDAQHAGPPSALMVRAFEAVSPAPMRIVRFSLEIFRPVPLSPLTISTEVVRDGARIRFLTGALSDADGQVARASAWFVRERDDSAPLVNEITTPHAPPDGLPQFDFAGKWPGAPYMSERSYGTAMELRFAEGSFFEPGPAAAWMRPRIALVDDEPFSPVQRVLVAADSGNGISMQMDPRRWMFVNVELTVSLLAAPAGPWVCLDAVTRIDPSGIGLAESKLWDATRLIGRGAQSLFVGPAG